MKYNKPIQKTIASQVAQKKLFTLAQANGAIVYVKRIICDVTKTYRDAMTMQKRLEYVQPEDDHSQLRGEYEKLIDRLNLLSDELGDVGVQIKDYELGMVDFPAEVYGREISFCWKMDDQNINTWHEGDDCSRPMDIKLLGDTSR